MILGTIQSAGGNRLQYTIDYRGWLQRGETLVSVVFSIDSGPATIDTVSYDPDKVVVRFFLNGGTAGTAYNIFAFATTSFGQQHTDQIAVQVASTVPPIAPAGNTGPIYFIGGQTGPTGLQGAGGAASTITGPTGPANTGNAKFVNYTAGGYYAAGAIGVVGGVGVTGGMYCFPLWVSGPCTIEAISFYISTAGAGAGCTFGAALYQNGTGANNTRPSTLLSPTIGSISTSTGAMTLALVSNASIGAAGWYWLVFQYGDSRMELAIGSKNAWNNPEIYFGSQTLSALVTDGIDGWSTGGTVQTWPNPFTGTLTSINSSSNVPWMAIEIASVP